jgi:hypothetical protein
MSAQVTILQLPAAGALTGSETVPIVQNGQTVRTTASALSAIAGSVSLVATGTGLTGGPITTTGTISLDNTTVTPGSYLLANITVNAQGQITSASNGIVASGVTSFSAGSTGFTPSTATGGVVTLAGTLATTNGGTGLGGATPFTANGVVYASSTSALTTGSALVFDGTNLGIGTSSPGSTLDVRFATNPATNNGNGLNAIRSYVSAALAADIGGAVAFGGTSTSGGILATFGQIAGRKENATSANYAGYLQFATNNAVGTMTERMRLDASGNLGLGVTPSASTVTAFQVPTSTVIGAQGEGINSTTNAYFDSAWKRHVTGTATWYQQATGQHAWYTAPSGTAGNAITFTQAMTLDASGNLGIGTTGLYGRLTVVPASTPTTPATANQLWVGEATSNSGYRLQLGYMLDGTAGYEGSIQAYAGGNATNLILCGEGGSVGIGTVSLTDTNSYGRILDIRGSSTTSGSAVYFGNSDATARSFIAGYGSSASNYLQLGTVTANSYVSFVTVNSEKMRLDASGNLGIGVSSPAAKLDILGFKDATNLIIGAPLSTVGGAAYVNYSELLFKNTSGSNSDAAIRSYGNVWNTAGSQLAFFTANNSAVTERMRLDNSGNLGLGQIPAVRKFEINAIPASVSQLNGIRVQMNGVATSASEFLLGTDSGGIPYTSIRTGNDSNGWMDFYTGSGPTERMRLTASGNLLVGTTTYNGSANVAGFGANPVGQIAVERDGGAAAVFNRFSSDGQLVLFRRQGTTVGDISVSTLGTTYNTTSDYRLKTVIGAVADSGSRIDALQPIEYTWNSNGSRTRGFLAHQFQEVYAGSVSGTKDAVDPEGNPVYQAMQAATSEVIADLVAEIQSLRIRITQLEAK